MKILIIGGTHGIGLQVTKQALAQGHTVTVLAREPRKLTEQHENLRVLKGDILDLDSIVIAATGQDVICSTIGIPPTRKPVKVFSQGTKNVLEAMKHTGVKRLISVTGIGAGDSRNHGGFLYDKIFQPLLLKTIYKDKDRQEALIRASDVEWIIVRPGFLTSGPARGRYRVLTDLEGIKAGRISRADVAHFILDQLTADQYLKSTPLLTY